MFYNHEIKLDVLKTILNLVLHSNMDCFNIYGRGAPIHLCLVITLPKFLMNYEDILFLVFFLKSISQYVYVLQEKMCKVFELVLENARPISEEIIFVYL